MARGDIRLVCGDRCMLNLTKSTQFITDICVVMDGDNAPDTSETSAVESYLEYQDGFISSERQTPSGDSSDAGTFLFHPDNDDFDENDQRQTPSRDSSDAGTFLFHPDNDDFDENDQVRLSIFAEKTPIVKGFLTFFVELFILQ
ncbi:unnamed protein product [Strongylus vulgaris]|uniref:Uncharacterized protein n=1 Tax=Strongylus vulgaris TaxID=40348 RepID=A0A3P7L1D2_STRVU|nr:unnamed protein product [Strongylus vulgaris]